MKRFMLAALTVAMVAINPAASADSGSNGGGRGGGGGSYHGGGGNHGGGNPGGGNHGGGNGGGSYHGGGNPGDGGSYHGGYPGGGHGPAYPPPKSAYPSQKAYRQARFNYPPYAAPYYRPYYRPYYPAPHYPAPYYGRGYYPRPVGYPAYYGYPYYYGNHHNNNNNSDWPAYLIGGAVLGSVLTNVYQNAQIQQAPAQQVVVAPQQGRRLLRDLNGNCYDRSTDAYGNELRTELPPSACNW